MRFIKDGKWERRKPQKHGSFSIPFSCADRKKLVLQKKKRNKNKYKWF